MKPKASLPQIATTSCAKYRYHHHHHRYLFLLLLLASFPSNFTAEEDLSLFMTCLPGDKYNNNCAPSPEKDDFKPSGYGFAKQVERAIPEKEDTEVINIEYTDEKLESKGMACPLEPRAFRELKATVPSAIRDRMRQLSKKVPTIESATEIAHSIEILKLFDESSPHLDGIREEVHKGAQMLRTAFDRISQHITDQKSVPSDGSETP